MPLGAEFAKILQAARIDGRARPRLVTLLWLVGVIFGYQTIVWLSSFLLLVRATEQSSGLLPGQRASTQSEHYWGCVWGGKTGSICHFAFSLVLLWFGGSKIPRCWEKQHEKCHCHTPFCVPQMLVKTGT